MSQSQPPTKKARREDKSVYQQQMLKANKAFENDYCVVHQRAAKAAVAASSIVYKQKVLCRHTNIDGKSVAQALVEKLSQLKPGGFETHVKKFIEALDIELEQNGDFCNWLWQLTPDKFDKPFISPRGKMMAWDMVLLALQHFTTTKEVQAVIDAYDDSTGDKLTDSVSNLTVLLDNDPYIQLCNDEADQPDSDDDENDDEDDDGDKESGSENEDE